MSIFGRPTTTSTLPSPALKDVEVSNPPTDSISSISFSPQADYLAVASWTNEVSDLYKLYENERELIRYSLISSFEIIGQNVRNQLGWSILWQGFLYPRRARIERLLEQGKCEYFYLFSLLNLCSNTTGGKQSPIWRC